jgi:hypothetical protein
LACVALLAGLTGLAGLAGLGAGVSVRAGSGRLEDAVTGMIPIRYVTDRFGFLYDRTWR